MYIFTVAEPILPTLLPTLDISAPPLIIFKKIMGITRHLAHASTTLRKPYPRCEFVIEDSLLRPTTPTPNTIPAIAGRCSFLPGRALSPSSFDPYFHQTSFITYFKL